jgi:phosphoglycolate phosphatase-like HAD superfamily hydrolase
MPTTELCARGVLFRLAAAVTLITVAACSPRAAGGADALASWNEGPVKHSILDFVARVTKEGGPDFVPPAERIATFDNDGTLWAEQPLYFQFLFALDRVKALAPQHPEWTSKEPFASLLRGDIRAGLAGGEKAIAQLVAATHAGTTTAEFERVVKRWLITARHPTLKRPYTELAYQPMLELLAYLRAHEFKTFIVSGGGVEFIRAFAEQVYGIPPEQVVGSTGKQGWQSRDGKPVLMKLPAVEVVDDGKGKPLGIQKFIGRRPIAAAGNSDGDLEMLQWTAARDGPSLCLYVHHTDGKREWAYDRHSNVGHLDRGLDEAGARGWTVVDMARDWNVIFPFETTSPK